MPRLPTRQHFGRWCFSCFDTLILLDSFRLPFYVYGIWTVCFTDCSAQHFVRIAEQEGALILYHETYLAVCAEIKYTFELELLNV